MSLKSLGVIAVIGVMFAGPLAGCSSDVEMSANDRFCADASQLKIDLRSLASFDVITLGTASLKAQIKAVQGDLDALKISAGENAKAELEAFDVALANVNTVVGALGSGEVSLSSAADVVRALGDVASAGAAVATKTAEACK